MAKATDQYNLGVINPDLAKEWHPTRNEGLNPRNVTPGSGKKVWWICGNGHEWKSPIYSRNRGSGCPLCNQSSRIDNYETVITNTDLLKEWHLTKNQGLNLRNLPAGFNKKVWWICKEGHEWEATVKTRIKGRGCPDCSTNVRPKGSHKLTRHPQKTQLPPNGGFAQPAFSQSSPATGFRKNKRYLHRTTVILEDADSGSWSYAQTKDLSHDGMSLESEVAFRPGTRLIIKINTQSFKSAPETYSTVVRWCKENASDKSMHTYGIGVKFI